MPVKRKPLGRLIGAFKTVSTKHINIARNTESATVWQRNYYEHIIRSEPELDRITRYIESNPARWTDDNQNPSRK
jgi:REP element-mobilizing transposase RayT